MEKLTKEELLSLLGNSEKPRKQRKAPDLDEEKKLAMLERLATMRETVKKNREAKKTISNNSVKEQEIDAVFEKKYGSKFDKMTELLTDLNENTKEQLKLKREKTAKKNEEIKEKEIKLEVKEAPPVPKTLTAIPSVPPPVYPKAFPIPNRPIFQKGNTRW